MMTPNNITIVDELWEAATRGFPVLSPEEQQAGIALLRELAAGEPVTLARLARALDRSIETTQALVRDSTLGRYVHADDQDQIIGFWGLSVKPTRHQLTVDGCTLWTWCAQDSLFIPELLGEAADIESRDPETGQLIRLTVSPDRVEAVQPADIVVSIARPETWDATSATRLMATACHFIFFFASRASGERWRSKHAQPTTVLLSLDEAVAFGKRANAHRFGAALARRRTGPA